MKAIEIDVINKVATNKDKEKTIVCGNSDYVIVFNFDEEWEGEDIKTARFVYEVHEEVKHQDVVFSGTVAPVPPLFNTNAVYVGVFAGDLRTTTPAKVYCDRSIICGAGTPDEPTPDVYAQIMKVVNDAYKVAKSVREDADNGVFNGEKGDKGDKGDAGVINFVVVAELPKEGNGDSIYLLPESDGEVTNRFGEYVFVDGKWEQIGNASVEVNLDEFVKKTDFATGTVAGVVRVGAGLKMEPYGLLITNPAGLSSIDARANSNAPIVPNTVDYAVRAALTNPKNVTWTPEHKAAARSTLGAISADDVDLSEYVKNTDFATADGTKAGIVKLKGHGAGGICVRLDGTLGIQPASISLLKSRSADRPMTPAEIENALWLGVTGYRETWDGGKGQMVGSYGNQKQLTDEEKVYAREWLGAVGDTDRAVEGGGSSSTGVPLGLTKYKMRAYGGLTVDSDGCVTIFAQSNPKADRRKGVEHQAITTSYFNDFLKESLAGDTYPLVLTEDEKTTACSLMGALKEQNPEFSDGGATRGYVYFINPNGEQTLAPAQIQAVKAGSIPYRDGSFNFYVGTPGLPYHCANKGYVDNLIAELTARIEALENQLNTEQ